MESYAARICFNTAGWVRPTGDAPKVEGKQNPTWAKLHGFGLEEWLFDFGRLLEGKKYAFLQPVLRSRRRLEGQTIGIDLWTISPNGERLRVGNIRNCEVLSPEIASAARGQFIALGWLSAMEREVSDVGGDPRMLRVPDATEVFNIRFLPSEADVYSPAKPMADDDPIMTITRYVLVRSRG